jgi:hypothetical protein
MSGAIPPLPSILSWRGAQLKAQEQLYLTLPFLRVIYRYIYVTIRLTTIQFFCLLSKNLKIKNMQIRNSIRCFVWL